MDTLHERHLAENSPAMTDATRATVLSRLMRAGQRVLLVGPPGCGKTARIASAAAIGGQQLVTMRASLSERVDFGGALCPDFKAGVTRSLPLEQLHALQQEDCPPTVLFLDDLGQAPVDVQAACMRLFDPGALGPNVLIWGATNRPGDKAGVSSLCEPLRSRFHLAFGIATPGSEDKPDGACMLGSWQDEVDQWIDWAFEQESTPEIIAWHRSTTGRALYAWKPHADPGVRMPDFRSWETVIRLRAAGIRDLSTTAAAVGKPCAAEFCAFEALADHVPTPDQVRMDPKGAPVPADPAPLYLVVTMLSCSAKPSDAEAFCTYMGRLPRVFGALLGRDMYRKMGEKLSGSKAWVKWFTENQQLFAGN